MNKKIYCFYCNKDVMAVCETKINTYTIHKKNIKIKEQVFSCPFCHNEILENNNLNNSLYNIYNEYLKLFNLSFNKFKEIRISYNLSQELFAKALGWSKRSIIRYENADSLPQKQYLLVYQKIANNKNEFFNILKNNESTMEKDIYYKIYNYAKAELDLKTINTVLYILQNNLLTKTQIMKYLFCIDFQSYKEQNKTITSFKYAHGTYGPVCDKKDVYLNFLIKQNYIDLVNNEGDISYFMPVIKYDASLFSEEELDIINKVIQQLKGKNAIELTNWSHRFKGWLNTKDGQIINYNYAKDFELDKNWN